MCRVLGIDTSNYTTSVAVVDNGKIVYDTRKLLKIKTGEKGLRQSEALFQHVNNLPLILNDKSVSNLDAVCVSIKPRPIEESYMPVFKAGQSIAEAIAYTNNINIYYTTHQEGHIEAACRSIDFEYKEFVALHLSGGTSEVLHIKRDKGYFIKKIGGTKDISLGQFIDRIGVALGFEFPAGKYVDSLAMSKDDAGLRIPSRVDGLEFNLSGQETLGLKYINMGYNPYEICYAAMLCISKTIEKTINNILKTYNLPVLIMGGVASSEFLRNYISKRFYNLVFFGDPKYASDNAVGIAYIGYMNQGGI
ncbi:O-sialoglycoprotein endopeptidase [Caloramator sp. E03]|uniref:O-sialoglycoprotein endopeptidase n=1 Tax=Caloramator sp. E03 TaxID=2576307 RepID=UPI001110EB28|nr:O-sialoglycoprotein endopeptidase [Caloramator sp. E03]QCX32696.1 O-sialoglycoprotein endopeptidase [Caloramator sp. E03]